MDSEDFFTTSIREDLRIDKNRLYSIQLKIIKLMNENYICDENVYYNNIVINDYFSDTLKSNDKNKIKRFYLLKKLAADIFDAEFLFRDNVLKLIKDKKTPQNLTKQEIELVNSNIIHLDILIFSSITVYILEETLIKKISDEIILSLLFISIKAIVETFEDHLSDKVLTKKIIQNVLKDSRQKLTLIKELLIPNNFKNLPNQKYSPEMIDSVSKKMLEGKKQYVAVAETLRENKMEHIEIDSFARQYRNRRKKLS